MYLHERKTNKIENILVSDEENLETIYQVFIISSITQDGNYLPKWDTQALD